MSARAPIKRIPLDDRITAFPIGRPNLYEFWLTAVKLFWSPSDYDPREDAYDYTHRLSDSERHLIEMVLGFFASADFLINVNIAERFKNEVDLPEASMWYNSQMFMEDIHSTVYSRMLETIVTDPRKRESLFDSVRVIPAVGSIAKFIQGTTDSRESFATRLVRMICAEGVLFFSSFAVIFWFGSRGLLHGLCAVNRLINRDETYHALFGVELYEMLDRESKLSIDRVIEIFEEAVAIGVEFVRDAVPVPLPGLNMSTLEQYVQYQADTILGHMGLSSRWGVANPYPFMQKMSLENKANFFEVQVVDYSHTIRASGARDESY